ncbi:MAG: hypothetical protein HOV81_33860 [Kofleriaceae bacterium]|nr:hypothetical protein [Kofleriaceae bacterium]
MEWLLIGGFVGWLGSVAVRSYGRVFRSDPLPEPGPPPEDRAEAVRRVLKHLQRKTISELDEGMAAVVVGTVHAIPGVPPLRSPLRGIECLGYHLVIRQGYLEATLHDDARLAAVEVRDETGAIRIDPRGLELAITDGDPTQGYPPHPPERLARLPPGYRYSPVLVEEGVLLPGARILVCGLVARELDASQYRDGAPVLVLRASATFPLVASSDADLFTSPSRPIAPEELRAKKTP